MSGAVYACARATGAVVEAPVLLCPVTFSARYDLDRTSGVITRNGHPLQGESIAGHILLAPGVQGGVAAGWALPDMQSRGVGFAGLIFGVTNPVMVQGAVTAGLPIAAGIDPAIFAELVTGDVVRLDPTAHCVTHLARARAAEESSDHAGIYDPVRTR